MKNYLIIAGDFRLYDFGGNILKRTLKIVQRNRSTLDFAF